MGVLSYRMFPSSFHPVHPMHPAQSRHPVDTPSFSHNEHNGLGFQHCCWQLQQLCFLCQRVGASCRLMYVRLRPQKLAVAGRRSASVLLCIFTSCVTAWFCAEGRPCVCSILCWEQFDNGCMPSKQTSKLGREHPCQRHRMLLQCPAHSEAAAGTCVQVAAQPSCMIVAW